MSSSSGFRFAAIALTSACTFSVPAGAQLLEHKDLSASMALTIAQTAIETCKANGYAVSATVVGRNGEIIVQVRGDNTPPHTMENSFRKAYTSRTLRSPSGALADRVKADPTLPFIHLSNIIAFQGALPIKVGDETIGAAGASGAPGGEKDGGLRQGRHRQDRRSAEIVQSVQTVTRRPSLSLNEPTMMRMKSISVQIPRQPNVRSWMTPVPTLPT